MKRFLLEPASSNLVLENVRTCYCCKDPLFLFDAFLSEGNATQIPLKIFKNRSWNIFYFGFDFSLVDSFFHSVSLHIILSVGPKGSI